MESGASQRIAATFDVIRQEKIIAVVRERRAEDVLPIVRALLSGGIRVIEITLTTPDGLRLIGEIASDRELQTPEGGPPLIGAGSVRSASDIEGLSDAGGRFAASPVLDREVLRECMTQGILMMPGGLTPNEIATAWEGGAPIVKLFPLPEDGVRYLSAVRAPMPEIPLAPSGGITAENAASLLAAGAVALNTGSWLTPAGESIEERCRIITARSRELRSACGF